ncbi:GrpB family protein [Ferrimonas sp.]|uniref:GrpB family protein n=1 Tax=Ferrimonas sp. TaxID=2080861 RepID=UPI003A937EC7
MASREIIVVPYCRAWPVQFQQEADSITALLRLGGARLHHIGSTAVPALAAKPVIDMLMQVPSLTELDEVSHRLEALGYLAKGEFGISGRRYFQKGGAQRSHHLHCYQVGSPDIGRHLAFRDYLRAHPDVARAYGDIKLEAAAMCQYDIQRYMSHKNDFIQRHEALALIWYGSAS